MTSENIIVRDTGFLTDDWTGGFAPVDEFPANAGADGPGLELDPGADIAALGLDLAQIALIRIDFASFADGRGFTAATRLRTLGFTGRLRAAGHVLADQYAMARRAGFDEVEISPRLAARQPEDQWLARADWQAGHYQARLRGQ